VVTVVGQQFSYYSGHVIVEFIFLEPVSAA